MGERGPAFAVGNDRKGAKNIGASGQVRSDKHGKVDICASSGVSIRSGTQRGTAVGGSMSGFGADREKSQEHGE